MATCPKCSVNDRLPSKAYCNSCWNAYQRQKRSEDLDYNAKGRERNKDPVVRKKQLARLTAAYHVSKKQPCQVCGFEPAERHHPDYDKPTEIVWLCKDHHLEEH